MSSVVAGDDVPGLACEAVRDEARSGRASQNGGSGIAGPAVSRWRVSGDAASGCCLWDADEVGSRGFAASGSDGVAPDKTMELIGRRRKEHAVQRQEGEVGG